MVLGSIQYLRHTIRMP